MAEENIGGRGYYVLRPNRELLSLPLWYLNWFADPAILLDARVREFAETGRIPEESERIDRPDVYIDADGVGLTMSVHTI